jgi:parallel beta-helix repeat protein
MLYVILLLLGLSPALGLAATKTIGPGDLGAATRSLSGGDVLILGDGTYTGCIDDTIPSGTAGSPTTIKAANPGKAVLRASCKAGDGNAIILIGMRGERFYITLQDFGMDGAGMVASGITVRQPTTDGSTRSHHISLVNLEVKNLAHVDDPSGTFGFSMAAGATDLFLHGNHVHDIGMNAPSDAHFLSYCMYWAGTNSIVEDNEFDHCSGYGIHGFSNTAHGTSSAGGNTIRRNYIHDNGAIGVLLCPAGNTLANNIIANNGWHQRDPGGVQMGGYCSGISADNNTIVNNTVVGNKPYCIRLGNSGAGSANTNTVKNNLCWQNSSDQIQVVNGSGNVLSNNLLGVNPQFADNFRLASGSPAIDAGVDVGLPYQGRAPDIGACETGTSACGGTGPPPPAQVPPPTHLRLLNQ